MNMNKIHYKTGKISVLLSFAAIIASICIGSMFVSSSNQVDALVQSSGNSSDNNNELFPESSTTRFSIPREAFCSHYNRRIR